MARRDPGDPAPANDVDRAYLGAIHGADAYRAIRQAVRRHGPMLRLGNRFVRADAFREIAFVALGRASISAGFALGDALGEDLTQGFLAGPDALPAEIPFLHRRVHTEAIGSPDAEAVLASVRELAEGLGPKDLLILVLTPGSLGLLATPPTGVGGEEYRGVLDRLRLDGATGPELERFVRATAGGLAGGRLLDRVPEARILPLVVDRGGAPEAAGGGPTMPLQRPERKAAQELLRSHGIPGGGSPALRRSLEPVEPTGPGRPGVRPVQVAGPAEALQGAGDALSERRWWSRLAAVALPGRPPEAARRFTERIEEVLREVPSSRESRRGIAIFAGAPLDCVDGLGEAEGCAQLLVELQRNVRRRGVTYAVVRTAGARTTSEPSGGGSFESDAPEIRPIAIAEKGRPGVTDVGPVVIALCPDRPRG